MQSAWVRAIEFRQPQNTFQRWYETGVLNRRYASQYALIKHQTKAMHVSDLKCLYIHLASAIKQCVHRLAYPKAGLFWQKCSWMGQRIMWGHPHQSNHLTTMSCWYACISSLLPGHLYFESQRILFIFVPPLVVRSLGPSFASQSHPTNWKHKLVIVSWQTRGVVYSTCKNIPAYFIDKFMWSAKIWYRFEPNSCCTLDVLSDQWGCSFSAYTDSQIYLKYSSIYFLCTGIRSP